MELLQGEQLAKSDFHVHTKYSFDGAKDGSGEPDAVAQAAVDAGLSRLALCDHCDIDDILDGIYPIYPKAEIIADVAKTKEKFAGKLEILQGIELGQPHARPEESRQILEEGGFDYVLGSLHNLRNYPDFSLLHYEEMTEDHIDYLVRRSLTELCEIASFTWGADRHIDTLAHITYIGRYLAKAGKTFDFMRYENKWRELFHILLENDIALEINTSGLRRNSVTMPDSDLIALWNDCGGRKFTLGSDAHTARDVGKGIAEAAKLHHIL